MAEFMQFAQVAGSALQIGGSISAGNNANAEAKFRAAQLDQAAGQTQASAQRAALEERRQTKLAQSRLLALSQGGSMDAGVVDLAADLAADGEYRALSALYEGDERAAGMRDQAAAVRVSGKNARTAGYVGAAATAFGSYKSLAEKYGGGGPSGGTLPGSYKYMDRNDYGGGI
jgi:hypothetical protein